MEKKKSYLSKQAIAAIIIGTVVLVALLLYFLVLKPYFDKKPAEVEIDDYEALIDGEVNVGSVSLYKKSGGKIKMYALPKAADSKQTLFSVKAQSGDWSFRITKNGIQPASSLNYMCDAMLAPYVYHIAPSPEQLKDLRAEKASKMSGEELESIGGINKLTLTREDIAGIEIDLAEYGLADLNAADSYTISDESGNELTVYLGDYTVDGKERYAMKKGLNVVYKLDENTSESVGTTVLDAMPPLVINVTDGASRGDYTPDKFIIMRDGKTYVNIEYFESGDVLNKDRMTTSLLIKSYKTDDGETINNLYDTSGDYSAMLYTYFTNYLYGQKVVAAAKSEKHTEDGKTYYLHGDIPEEVFEQFGIDLSAPYRVLNTVKYTDRSSKEDALENLLLFSRPYKDEDGKTYFNVYSFFRGVIIKIAKDKIPFIEENEDYYISKFISLFYYRNLDTITLDGSALPDSFIEPGMEKLKESFTIKYKMKDGKRELDSKGEIVEGIRLSDGSAVPDTTKGESGTDNFQLLYYHLMKLMMYTNIEQHLSQIEKCDLSDPQMTLSYSIYGTDRKHDIKFYFFDEAGLWAFFTFDGEGRYIVRTSDLKKIVKGFTLVKNGGSVADALGKAGS